ncbi:autotransporter assembly complex family protein [Pseudomonas sp. HR96]|uniref:autotransporter assembly complex protein TamA n=1 Tax=Pseudomonas sp. HR96 TaxID=1027966 RepID=UPI002A74A282|nr:autotransporter assembly complex family protein [Pseudomonas sp. HR96]WPP01514.1 autotransporter assembly complex family protein [Pseudomonas sp. HR96]
MRFSVPITSGLVLLVASIGAQAQGLLDVRVQPADPALKANIEGYIGSVAERDERALRRSRRAATEQAKKAAQALGFYQAQIDASVQPGSNPTLILTVQPGEPVRLRHVTLRVEGGLAELKGFRLPDVKALRPGMPLNHGLYDDAKRLILNQASRYGFFSGHFTAQRLSVDPAANVADIELVYQSGPRYTLGAVQFAGDTPFDHELLQRMVPFKEGAPYDSDLVNELNQALQSSGYFEGVRVDASPTAATAQKVIPVQVNLTTRKPRTMGLGVGYSTDVGPRLKANWTRHWVNSAGDSYGAEAEVSSPRQNIGLWYDTPLDPPLTDKLRWAGGYQYEEIANTDALSKLLTVGPEWHSKLPSGWERVISLKAQREEYRLGDDSGLSTLLMPGISYGYLKSDNKVDPHNGYRLQFDAQVAKQGLLSDTNLVHGNVLLKGLTTVADNHRLLGRLQLGGSVTNGYKSIPPSLRFFAGGDQSVRGYAYQSLSPENSDGDRIGGRYMVAGSVEYQYSIAEKWRIATFVDQGNSFNNLELPSLKTGVGVGIRWVSPVGPIRVDLAHPLDDDGGIRLHFSMGPEL